MFPVDGGDVHTLISNAELSNKSAKALGKNQSFFMTQKPAAALLELILWAP
jgi:hypothetical protein